MKKYGIAFFALLLLGCGATSENIQNTKFQKPQAKSKASKPSIWAVEPKDMEITPNNQDEYLIGTWEAEELGVILEQFGISLPARLVFNADGSYNWEYFNNGVKAICSGKYKILDKKTLPYKIILYQESEVSNDGKPISKKQSKEMSGIMEITKNKKLKIVFYDRDFIPKVEEFQGMDVQIYRRTK